MRIEDRAIGRNGRRGRALDAQRHQVVVNGRAQRQIVGVMGSIIGTPPPARGQPTVGLLRCVCPAVTCPCPCGLGALARAGGRRPARRTCKSAGQGPYGRIPLLAWLADPSPAWRSPAPRHPVHGARQLQTVDR